MQAGHPSFLVMDFVSGCKHAATISVDAFRSFIEANELVVRCGVLFRPWVQHGSALVAGESIVFRLQARVSSLTVKCSKCSGLPPDLWICLHVCDVPDVFVAVCALTVLPAIAYACMFVFVRGLCVPGWVVCVWPVPLAQLWPPNKAAFGEGGCPCPLLLLTPLLR